MPCVNRFTPILLLLALPLLAVAQNISSDADPLNQIFGVKIWSDDCLWDDTDNDAARRLNLSPESKTSYESSFRRYPHEEQICLGARIYSLALYGKAGRVSRVSLVFANKGDIEASFTKGKALNVAAQKHNQQMVDSVNALIQESAKSIERVLTESFGAPRRDVVFEKTRMEEELLRWDWKGHAFLMASPPNEYTMLRIMPVTIADAHGMEPPQETVEWSRTLTTRVMKRPNGDVIIQEVPMVDQGGKSYCVPATWERYLRYMGIPADMYVLAMAGHTRSGAGTSMESMVQSIQDLVTKNQHQTERVKFPITADAVATYIDQGTPLMWNMFVVPEIDRAMTERMHTRPQDATITSWGACLDEPRRAAKNLKLEVRSDEKSSSGFAHMCMLIGYNRDTHEVALSDSWGPEYAERWLTEEEAQAINYGGFWIIK